MVWTGMPGNQEKIIEGACVHDNVAPNTYDDYIKKLNDEKSSQDRYRKDIQNNKNSLPNKYNDVRPKIDKRYQDRMRTIYSSAIHLCDYIIARNDKNTEIYKELITGYTNIKQNIIDKTYFTNQITALNANITNEKGIKDLIENNQQLSSTILTKKKLNDIYNDIRKKIPGNLQSRVKFIADFTQISHNEIYNLANRNIKIYGEVITEYLKWTDVVVKTIATARAQAIKVEPTCTYEVEIKLANEIYDIIIDKTNTNIQSKKDKIIILVNKLENVPCYSDGKDQFKELKRIMTTVSDLKYMLELLKHWYVRYYVSGCDNQIKQYKDLNFENSSEYNFSDYPKNQDLIKILIDENTTSCKKLGEIQKILPYNMISTQSAAQLGGNKFEAAAINIGNPIKKGKININKKIFPKINLRKTNSRRRR